ncbi:MAG: PQQ-dependent sugar dehydrogenase [Rhodobacterales bacterium]|nr:PQQ-dependent sugar dehydrogenase [Rhodobacterales bacterium]
MLPALLAALTILTAPAAAAGVVTTSAGPMQITAMATGLDETWALDFLPDNRFLVTERDGRLTLFPASGGADQPIAGLPQVAAQGQGGLLDVTVARDFARTGEIFLTFARPQDGGGAGTALAVARLDPAASRLDDLRLLFEMAPGVRGGQHFGSRVVEGTDGHLYLTLGDRGTREHAQDLSRHEGSVVRLTRDGRPAGAPELAAARPELYSKGHRNPQGAALDLQGNLWVVEHGARGGDELNRVQAGRNYGWPVITYGRDYDGSRIGEGRARPGLEQPVHYWDPSIAPSGLLFHSGRGIPAWKGDVFTGSLNAGFISRLDPDRGHAEERIEAPETGRVRDLAEAADGAIWFL